ncbi:hypothetical protein KPATCC21470_7026 [Kitasatospora purpeofusca]
MPVRSLPSAQDPPWHPDGPRTGSAPPPWPGAHSSTHLTPPHG